jgi:hypothetical protein
MEATAVGAPSTTLTAVVSTPSAFKSSRYACPAASVPTDAQIAAIAPHLAAATAADVAIPAAHSRMSDAMIFPPLGFDGRVGTNKMVSRVAAPQNRTRGGLFPDDNAMWRRCSVV